jgi:acyl-CoA synthetase (NDP forming)
MHDSGGERQLLLDLADAADVPLTRLQPETIMEIEQILDPELPAVNPLDAWSRGGPDAGEQRTRSLSAMMRDPGAAFAAVVHDRAPEGKIYSSYLTYMQRARAESGKLVVLVAARQGTGYDKAVVTSTRAGFPVLDGVATFLKGVHALFAYRDFQLREKCETMAVDPAVVAKWRTRLAGGDTLGEAESLAMFGEFSLTVADTRVIETVADLADSAAAIGYPLVAKTAMPGVLHKSEHNGVVLNVQNESQLRECYDNLTATLGAAVLLAPMAADGIEMILGAHHDPQFGPVVLIGIGGVLAEVARDVVFAMPPFDAAHARRCVDRLRFRTLLDGVRGKPPADVDAFCDVAAKFSSAIFALGDVIDEVDINPVIVHEVGCTVVDALVVGRCIRN